MATISSAGIGSGLDVKSIVSQLVALEKKPLDKLALEATTVNAKISAFGEIKSLFSTLSSAASSLNSLTTWNAVTATSSNSTAVTATAVGGTAASEFSVEVTSMANAQSTASQSFTAGTKPGAGNLSIQLGSWSAAGGTFTPGTAVAKTIAVTASDKISDIASKINGANAGVNATVMTDPATGSERLLLRSTTTGKATGFKMTVTDEAGNTTPANLTDNNDLSRLVFETVVGDTMTQLGTNAVAKLNGLAIESATNTFTNVVAGVSFTALQKTTAAATINVGRDNSAITAGIQAFVDAYNKINETMVDATKYDAATKVAGMFQGDSSANGLLSAMRSMLQAVTAGGAFSRLADVGITAQRGGNLSIDSAKLNTALSSKFTDIKNLFKAEASPAKAQSTASLSLTAGTTPGAGTLSIRLGSWDFPGGTFTPGSVAAVPITVAAGDTIAVIASKINGAGAGVNAEVKTDPTTGKERLLLSSTSTGKEAGFQMTVTDEAGVTTPAANLFDNTGLSRLVFEATAGDTMTQLGTNNVPTDGVAVRFKKLADGLLSIDGFFSSKDGSLKRSLLQNSKNQATVNDRAASFEARLNKQYSALDAKMASLTALNAYVAQQVTTWNKSGG
jgi:flagellar hook-associated protein 2